MKPLTFLTDTLACVEVPIDAKDIYVGNVNEQVAFLDYDDNLIPLPCGNWKYIGYCTKDEVNTPDYYQDEESFYKLRKFLSSKGLYFINPLVKPYSTTTQYDSDRSDWWDWQQAEQSLIQGKLAFLKLLK